MDSKEHIDLRLRIFNDGGPLYHLLAAIEKSSPRNDRMRQLAYLGALIETGRFALTQTAQSLPGAANVSKFAQSAAPDIRQNGQPHIDLRLRIFNDGGPVYQLLAAVGDSSHHNDRVRNLAYLGVLAEGARFAGVQPTQLHQTAANAANFAAGPVPANRHSIRGCQK
ncbi:MAG TPA: hypothetical protein VLA64_05905 [Azonexus sp.]|nr:hypothetical protein [Azonexus sp.]